MVVMSHKPGADINSMEYLDRCIVRVCRNGADETAKEIAGPVEVTGSGQRKASRTLSGPDYRYSGSCRT